MARHSLQFGSIDNSDGTVLFYSEYNEDDDAYTVHYSLLDIDSAKEVLHGKAEIYYADYKQPVYNVRKILAINEDGISILQYLEDDEVRLAIATIRIRK